MNSLKGGEEIFDWIPSNAKEMVNNYLLDDGYALKMTRKRGTKHGDFRRYQNGRVQISLNRDENRFRVLITFIHELAHFRVYKNGGAKRPHGKEWKQQFKLLMLPFLRPEIFPDQLLRELARHMKNPSASSDTDLKLAKALSKYDAPKDGEMLMDLEEKSRFQYKNKIFIKGEQRRTRFSCVNEGNQKTYLFHPLAEVFPVKN